MSKSVSSIAIAFLATLVSSSLGRILSAQDFREPSVPGAANLAFPAIPADSASVLQRPATPAPNSSSGFVPGASNEGLGMVPVRPRTGSPPGQDFQQLRPDYSGGRSEEEARILEQMRAENYDDPLNNSGTDRPDQRHQIIRQRYPDGKVQLMRQVAQDEDGNYFNDGPWQLFNNRGELMASGQFVNGVMDGRWERWHAANSTGMFRTKPFTSFEGPFVSTATFKAGKLDGTWSISDRNQRTIVEVAYTDGKRNGTATWLYPSSQQMRTAQFKVGLLDGPLQEWDEQNQLVRNDEYLAGQKVIRVTSFFRPEQKSSEEFFLDSPLELDGQDNWWDAEPAEYRQNGTRVQHGPAAAWHSNGQQKLSGQYLKDVRVGPFSWWHENGTQALAGRYEKGRKQGRWTWWHDNGMKSIEGSYADDDPTGQWTWWDEDGRVSSQEDFGEGSTGELVEPDESTDGDDSSPEGQLESELKDNPPSTGIPEMEEIRPVEVPETDKAPATGDPPPDQAVDGISDKVVPESEDPDPNDPDKVDPDQSEPDGDDADISLDAFGSTKFRFVQWPLLCSRLQP